MKRTAPFLLMFLLSDFGIAKPREHFLSSPLSRAVACSAVLVGAISGGVYVGVNSYQDTLRESAARSNSPAKYDTDRNGVFSSFEIESFDYADLANYLGRFPLETQWQILEEASDSKIARTLLQSRAEGFRKTLFSEIITVAPHRSARILIAAKERPDHIEVHGNSIVPSEGNAAYLLLEGIEAPLRRAVLDEVGKLDPIYQENILFTLDRTPQKKERSSERIQSPENTGNIFQTRDERSTPEVFMNEYLFTNFSKHKKMQTQGAGPCVVTTLWDPKTGTGMMAHFPDSQPETIALGLDRILSEFQVHGIRLDTLEVGLVGGLQSQSNHMIWEIKHRLESAGMSDGNFKYLLTLGEGGTYKNVELDLRTGAVSTFEGTVSSQSEKMRVLTLRSLSGPVVRHESALPSPVYAQP